MSTFLGILLLALPTLLVIGLHLIWRDHAKRVTRLAWVIVGATWVAAIWFWIDYNRQTDDVGLIVNGIIAGALTLSALAATLAALVVAWRAR